MDAVRSGCCTRSSRSFFLHTVCEDEEGPGSTTHGGQEQGREQAKRLISMNHRGDERWGNRGTGAPCALASQVASSCAPCCACSEEVGSSSPSPFAPPILFLLGTRAPFAPWLLRESSLCVTVRRHPHSKHGAILRSMSMLRELHGISRDQYGPLASNPRHEAEVSCAMAGSSIVDEVAEMEDAHWLASFQSNGKLFKISTCKDFSAGQIRQQTKSPRTNRWHQRSPPSAGRTRTTTAPWP